MPDMFTYAHQGMITRISALDDGLIRITRTRREIFLDHISPVVVCRERIQGMLDESPEEMVFSTSLVTVRINRQTGAAGFYDAQGKLLLRDLTAVPICCKRSLCMCTIMIMQERSPRA